MAEIDIEELIQQISDKILLALTTMSKKQRNSKAQIGLDSLALVLRLKIVELMPIVEYLERNGKVTIHRNINPIGRAARRPDKVSLN